MLFILFRLLVVASGVALFGIGFDYLGLVLGTCYLLGLPFGDMLKVLFSCRL